MLTTCNWGPGVQLALLSRVPRFRRLLLVLEGRCWLLGAFSIVDNVVPAFLGSSGIILGALRRVVGLQRRWGRSWALWYV